MNMSLHKAKDNLHKIGYCGKIMPEVGLDEVDSFQSTAAPCWIQTKNVLAQFAACISPRLRLLSLRGWM